MAPDGGQAGASASILVRDERSGKTTQIPIKDSTVSATGLKPLGLTVYDPGYLNTASCTSRITFIDGAKGILRYRGYGVEELAENSSFLEVAFLLLQGELPSPAQLRHFTASVIVQEMAPHAEALAVIDSFRRDAHSMAVMVSALAALGAVHPEANPALHPSGQALYKDRSARARQVVRLLGCFPSLAAHWLLRRQGLTAQPPAPLEVSSPLSYTEAFLRMCGLGRASPLDARPHPAVVRALDTLLIVHADHELNCSTAAVRHLTSSGVDVYTAVAGGTGALYGPLHGGATEAVLRMLERIQSAENIPGFLAAVKEKKERLMGFGHRVYRSYDPRAKIVRKLAYDVFGIYGSDPLIDVATALEKAARADNYFVSRDLYPNIDFYSGLIYKAIGFPTDFFPVLFAMGRMAGWLAHWEELCEDREMKIVRPRQVYKGPDLRPYVPAERRSGDCPTYDAATPLAPARARL